MNADRSAADHDRRRILIADDCATSRMLEETILRRGGHEILFASEGDQVAALAARLAPDLILLDLQLQKLNGLEVLKELKRSAETRQVPVIVVTTCADSMVYKEAAESGCAGFLTKPFEAETLLLAVEANLAARGRTHAPKADRAGSA